MTDKMPLTTYAQFVQLLEDLPAVIRHTRRQRAVAMRAAAEEAGVPHTTIARAENGQHIHTKSLVALLKWCDLT